MVKENSDKLQRFTDLQEDSERKKRVFEEKIVN